jgi:hypothetical protein
MLLKSLIGTATTGDLDRLHTTIAGLHQSHEIMTHAVEQQMTLPTFE